MHCTLSRHSIDRAPHTCPPGNEINVKIEFRFVCSLGMLSPIKIAEEARRFSEMETPVDDVEQQTTEEANWNQTQTTTNGLWEPH